MFEAIDENEDRELVKQLKRGDIQAFELLYHRYKRPVSSGILRLVRSVPVTEDLVHDLFVKVWNNRGRLDEDRSFRAYMYRMSENMAIDFFRKAAQDLKFRDYVVSNAAAGYSHIEEELDSKEKKHLLTQAMAILPPQCRLAFTLCKLEGKSSEEAATQLNVSPHTISNHLARASKLMKKFLLANAHDASTLSLIFFLLHQQQ